MGFGVFPGLDVDRDGVQDNVWYNGGNRILTYYDQPFFFGDDFNNNGQIDGWENDNRADYPYDHDSRGGHGFVTWRPLPEVDDLLTSTQGLEMSKEMEYQKMRLASR